MKICPSCKSYSYEYDPSLGRFACLRTECGYAEKNRCVIIRDIAGQIIHLIDGAEQLPSGRQELESG